MLVYYLYYLVVISLGILLSNRNRGLYLTVCFFLLFFIIAFRHPSMGIDLHYGTDYGYLGAYEYFAGNSWKVALSKGLFQHYELGYVVYNKIISYFSDNYQMLLISTTAITFVPVFSVINKESEDPLLSIVVYLGLSSFLMVFSALRQTIAISLLFSTIPLIRKKRFYLQLFIVLVAALFHKTALVFLIAYSAYHIRIQPALRFHTLYFLIILYCLSSFVFPLFTRIYGAYSIDNNGSNTLFIVYVFIYYLCFIIDTEGEYNGLLNLFFIACCLMCFEHLNNVVSRIAMYFEMPLILLLSAVFKNKIREYSLVRLIIILCFTFAGLYFLRTTFWTMSYPYHFMWEII